MVDSIVELNRSRSEVLQIQRKLPDKPLPDDIREFADSASEFPSVAPPLSSASSSASQSNFVSTESIDEVQRQTGMFSGARNIRMREAQMNSVGGNMTINNIVYYAAGSQVQISLVSIVFIVRRSSSHVFLSNIPCSLVLMKQRRGSLQMVFGL